MEELNEDNWKMSRLKFTVISAKPHSLNLFMGGFDFLVVSGAICSLCKRYGCNMVRSLSSKTCVGVSFVS
ncbi:unnamed protein product [Trifolium pratense]|uniref:Uncharacterized protein n=1 Tax=Trifolium pratense TaxID=57577 RepID=A0ACB0K6L2_TRIPR|nr:unnamed protein product [Trifolium pratense]